MATDSANSDSSPPPNKRLKTTEVRRSESESKPDCQQFSPNSPSRSLCAICFAGDDGDGRASRGEIDCCEHYYCFLCIVEWARTESRCPVCRRRFTTIRRPPKPGVFARERLITVPVRDQACNATGSFDPYAEVSCSVCHSAGDDCLLLLCDLCDSAAHTFCVGLGVTVPEGDWFCHDCALSRAERANSEKETEDMGQVLTSLVAERSPPRVSSEAIRSSPPAVPDRKDGAVEKVTRRGTRTLLTGLAKKKSTDSGARTLDRCRSVHDHIRAMRENWNALRSGSLSFSSSGSHRPCRHSQKHESNAASQRKSGQVESSSSMGQQSKDQGCSGLYDIDRAWKMMDIAKSKQCGRRKTSSLQLSKVPPSKASASEERTRANSNCMRKNQQFMYRSLGGTEIEKSFKGKETKKYQFLELEKEKQSRVITNEAAGCSSNLSTNCSPRLSEHSLFENITCVGDNTCQEHSSTYYQENVNKDLSNLSSERDGLACSVRQVVSDSFDVNSELSTSSSKVGIPKGNIRLNNKDRRHDDAKSEIQSLVKLYLKLISREKPLGVNLFKEIARFATHTILAACGLEHHKKYGVHSFPSSVCCHIELSQEIPRSSVMSKTCQQCFNCYVKDVVTSIMFERVGCAKSSQVLLN